MTFVFLHDKIRVQKLQATTIAPLLVILQMYDSVSEREDMMEKKLDFRIEKTYLSLHNAFTALLEENHFEDFTVNDLCEKAMIRRTTFYKHFADKFDYFSFYLKEICETFQAQLAPDIISTDINQYFLHMCRALLQFVSKHEKIVNSIMGSNMFPMLFDMLAEQIRNDLLLAYSRIRKSTDNHSSLFEYRATFYVGGLLNTLREWMKKEKSIEEEKFIYIISQLLVSEEAFHGNRG